MSSNTDELNRLQTLYSTSSYGGGWAFSNPEQDAIWKWSIPTTWQEQVDHYKESLLTRSTGVFGILNRQQLMALYEQQDTDDHRPA
jgi:hypothetical protein